MMNFVFELNCPIGL